MSNRILVALFTITFLFRANLSGQPLGFAITGDRDKAVIPIEVVNNLVIMPVILNGMLPLRFILDTGVRTTILTEKTFSDILNLPYSRKYSIAGPGGVKNVDAYVTNNVTLDLPGVHGEGHAMLVLAEDYLQLRNYLGTDVHGILGYELFSRFVVKIDYENKLLTIMKPRDFRAGHRYVKVPISVEDTKPYMHASVLQVDDTQLDLKLLMDSGASHSLMLDPFSDSHVIVPKDVISSSIGRGLGGLITGKVGRVKKLGLGSFQIVSPIVNYPDANSYNDSLQVESVPRNGSIGGEVLSRFTVVFDFPDEKVYLKKNHSFKDKFYFNLSGLVIKANGSHLNSFEIAEVREKSAAQKAGLMEGDAIMAVNGIATSTLMLSEVIGYLNQRPGKKVRLEVIRSSKRLKIDLKLRDQI